MKTFIIIEPVMCFSFDFAEHIKRAEPWGVAVGYDNYKNNLPEPSLRKTESLIAALEEFTTVYRKTIREACKPRGS